MSREFGSYVSGYFHYQMQVAAEDCLGGSDELTRLWGAFFTAFDPVAYAIASSEAGDGGRDDSIMENIRQQDALKKALRDIEKYLEPYESIMRRAIREHEYAAKATTA